MTAPATSRAQAPHVAIGKGLRSRPPHDSRLAGQLGRTLAWVALLMWAAFAVLPMVWLILAATKTGPQLATEAPLAFGSFTTTLDAWQNVEAFNDGVLYRWLWNTVLLTGGQMLLTLIATIPAGYALGACQFRLRKPILIGTLALILLPGGALVLPVFLEVAALGLIGDRLAVILPGSVFPLGLFLTFIYFSTTVSRDIYDAARIDGCNEWQIFRRIALPLSRPIVALVAFFTFVRNWGDFLQPYIMLHSDQFPLPVGLAILASASNELNPTTPGTNVGSSIGTPEVVVATLITMVPVLLLLIVAQRTILRGSTMLGGALRA